MESPTTITRCEEPHTTLSVARVLPFDLFKDVQYPSCYYILLPFIQPLGIKDGALMSVYHHHHQMQLGKSCLDDELNSTLGQVADGVHRVVRQCPAVSWGTA